jgi:transcriptional regulator with XRE-family HTH domain
MIFLKENMRFLRKRQGMTQDRLADFLETKRSLIGSYEEGRGVPKLDMIRRMAEVFEVTLDDLLSADIENKESVPVKTTQGLKILSVTVTPGNDELITIVPVKASAGYLNGRADPEYIGQLPHFSMPVAELSPNRSYRVFQIKGDSMLPVPPGSYVFCDYVEEAAGIREGKAYVLITADEGVVYKRIYIQNDRELLLKSDNPEYEPYTVETSSVLEIWRALGYLSFDLPEPGAMHMQKLSSAVLKLEEDIKKIKGQKGRLSH